jgi:hypothetical protein
VKVVYCISFICLYLLVNVRGSLMMKISKVLKVKPACLKLGAFYFLNTFLWLKNFHIPKFEPAEYLTKDVFLLISMQGLFINMPYYC